MSQKSYSKSDNEWLDKITQLGCCVCRSNGIWSPASPHHIEGRVRDGCHKLTIPLCGVHHQTGGEGVAFHATGKKTWYKKYGSEYDFLEQTKGLVND